MTTRHTCSPPELSPPQPPGATLFRTRSYLLCTCHLPALALVAESALNTLLSTLTPSHVFISPRPICFSFISSSLLASFRNFFNVVPRFDVNNHRGTSKQSRHGEITNLCTSVVRSLATGVSLRFPGNLDVKNKSRSSSDEIRIPRVT